MAIAPSDQGFDMLQNKDEWEAALAGLGQQDVAPASAEADEEAAEEPLRQAVAM